LEVATSTAAAVAAADWSLMAMTWREASSLAATAARAHSHSLPVATSTLPRHTHHVALSVSGVTEQRD